MLRLFLMSLWVHTNLEGGAFEEAIQSLRRKNRAWNMRRRSLDSDVTFVGVDVNFSARVHPPIDGVPHSNARLGMLCLPPSKST